MAHPVRWLAAPLALALCTGCGSRAEPEPQDVPAAPPLTDETLPETAPPDTPAAAPTHIPARPAQVRDTIYIEGMPEPMQVTLTRAPSGFAVAFSTYVPTDMRAQYDAAGDTAGVRFSAAFTGTPHPNAYMFVRFHPQSATRAQVQQDVHAFLRSRAPEGDEALPRDPPDWADESFTFRYSGDGGVPFTGTAFIAHHAGRFFHVLIHYPAEFGDGLGPRLQYILDQWRWEDTGQPLIARQPH